MKSTHSGLTHLHTEGAGTSNPSSVHQKNLSTSSHANPGSPPPTPFLSPSSVIKPRKTFFDIDTDVFLLITTYLEVRDIIALRLTCKALSQTTMDHSVWSTLVTTNVFSKRLPWPSYAWPLSRVPTVTLEHLCIRAVQMPTKWDTRRSGNDTRVSRCLQRPWNSVTWMAMFRSRWLFVQLNGRRLELWDLSSPFTSSPVSYFDGLDDMVDGHKFSRNPDESSMIALSVRSYKTYHIRIVLPQISDLASQTPHFGMLSTVAGCSGLLDIYHDLALFSRSSRDDGAIAQCQQSAAITVLQSVTEDPYLDYAVGAKAMPHFVIIVRRTSIEFYSVDMIQHALQSVGQTPNGINQVLPTQSIPFPGSQHAIRVTFLSNPLHCVGLPYYGNDGIFLGLDRDERATRTIQVVYPDTSDGGSCRFTLSPPLPVLDIPICMSIDPTVRCLWGETGRRMVHVVDVGGLIVRGLSVPIGFGAERFVVPVDERYVFSWKIPCSRRDLVRDLAFDEATGLCAVALGSGRIWILDPIRGTEFRDAETLIKDPRFADPPHPDPAWAFSRRKPWAGDYDHPSASRSVLLPRMSTKVQRWFPGKNNPKAFGSIRWFINEALHIPGPATTLLFGTPRPQYRPKDSYEVVALKGRLLYIERDDDMRIYDVKLLDKNITLQSVVEHLKGGRLLRDLPGLKVAVDGFSVNRYGSWRQRWGRDWGTPLCMW